MPVDVDEFWRNGASAGQNNLWTHLLDNSSSLKSLFHDNGGYVAMTKSLKGIFTGAFSFARNLFSHLKRRFGRG